MNLRSKGDVPSAKIWNVMSSVNRCRLSDLYAFKAHSKSITAGVEHVIDINNDCLNGKLKWSN